MPSPDRILHDLVQLFIQSKDRLVVGLYKADSTRYQGTQIASRQEHITFLDPKMYGTVQSNIIGMMSVGVSYVLHVLQRSEFGLHFLLLLLYLRLVFEAVHLIVDLPSNVLAE